VRATNNVDPGRDFFHLHNHQNCITQNEKKTDNLKGDQALPSSFLFFEDVPAIAV
jgi:hypothetical protein